MYIKPLTLLRPDVLLREHLEQHSQFQIPHNGDSAWTVGGVNTAFTVKLLYQVLERLFNLDPVRVARECDEKV